MYKIGLIYLFLSIVTACGTVKQGNSVYKFQDQPYRNMVISINTDSSFSLTNNVGYGWGFKTFGKWSRLSSDMILLETEAKEQKNRVLLAAPQGIMINEDSAQSNTAYVFPDIIIDTLTITHSGKSVILKGYVFTHIKKTNKLR